MRTPTLLPFALSCAVSIACSDDAPPASTSSGNTSGSTTNTANATVGGSTDAGSTTAGASSSTGAATGTTGGSTGGSTLSSATTTDAGNVTGAGTTGDSSSQTASQTAAGTTTGAGGASTTSTSASATTGGTTGGGTLASSVCPAGSESMAPTLTGTPTRVAGVPPDDGYGLFNIEGPVWVNGALYMSQIASGQNPPPARILKYTPGGAVEVWKDDVGTNGLALDTNGVLYGASHKDGSISTFDLNNAAAAPVPVVSQYMGTRFSSPNDLTISSSGRVYFTDPNYQAGNEQQPENRAYWFELSNPSVINVIPGTPQQPNGISLSPDEQTLYVAGQSGTLAYPINADGSPGTSDNFGPGGIDGMGVDCAGNVYLTSHGAGEVLVMSPAGMQIGSLSIGASGVTNVAFGGSDRTTLYITRLDSNEPGLYEVNVGIVGLPY